MSALIRAMLSTESIRLQPGEKAELTLTVQNMSEIVDRFRIAVEGLDPAWAALSRTELSLFPKDQDQVRLTIAPPAGPSARAGAYDLRVQVTSLENPSERTTLPLALEVAAQAAFEASLRPQMQSGLKEGVFTLHLRNGGNSDLSITLTASDPEEGCVYAFSPARTPLPAGQERLVQLTVRPKVPRAPQGGKTYSFTVVARPEELPQQARQVPGQWQQLAPKRRIWPILVTAAVGLPALAALAFFVVVPLLQSRQLPGPSLPVAQATPVTPRPTTPAPASTRAPASLPTHTPVPTRTPTPFPAPSIRIVWPSLRPVLPVLPTPVVTLNLVPLAPSARWINYEGTVLDFGFYDPYLGAAMYGYDALMEDGNTYDRILATIPGTAPGQGIQGDFSVQPYLVGAGDYLVIEAGLLDAAKPSDGVRFRALLIEQSGVLVADARRGGGGIVLWEAFDTYDGRLVGGRISLDAYAGRTVWFLLQAMAEGSSADDWAAWIKFQVQK